MPCASDPQTTMNVIYDYKFRYYPCESSGRTLTGIVAKLFFSLVAIATEKIAGKSNVMFVVEIAEFPHQRGCGTISAISIVNYFQWSWGYTI